MNNLMNLMNFLTRQELLFLHRLKSKIECMARHYEDVEVRQLRAKWSKKQDQEASERFDIQMLYPQLIEAETYPKFKEEYRKQREVDAYPPEAILFFNRFIAQYYLKKSELDYLEEAFSILKSEKPDEFKGLSLRADKFIHYEDLCLKIALFEREVLEREGYLDGVPKSKKIPPTRNIVHRTGEIHYLPN